MNEKTIIKYMAETKYIEGEYICWDFVRTIYKDEYDIELPEYPVDEVQAEFKNRMTSNIPNIRVETKKAIEGDIIVFSLFANQHAGVMINRESFIHLTPQGVRVSDVEDVGGNYVIYRKI